MRPPQTSTPTAEIRALLCAAAVSHDIPLNTACVVKPADWTVALGTGQSTHMATMTGDHGSQDFVSCVWRLIGTLRSEAGWLDLTAGRLRYTTETREVFDVRLDDVTDVVWPWYYFGGGVKLRVAREQYRFSFVQPNGAELPTVWQAYAGDLAALAIVERKGDEVPVGRQAGKEWRRRFEAAGLAAAPPLAGD